MKLKKLFAGLVASAMAVSTMASMAVFEASAEIYDYTGTPDQYGMINYSFDITALDDDDLISVSTYRKSGSTQEWPTLLVELSDEMTNWGNNCMLTYNIDTSATEAQPDVKTVTVGDLKAKYKAVVGSDWTTDTKFRLGFWNDGYADTKVTVDTSYVAPTTDVWVKNSDGTYTYTATVAGGTNTGVPALDLSELNGECGAALVKITVDGYSNGAFGGNDDAISGDNKWISNSYDLSASSDLLALKPGGTLSGAQLQLWWVNAGTTVTVKPISVPKSDTFTSGSVTAGTTVMQYGYDNDGVVYARCLYFVKLTDVLQHSSCEFAFSYNGGTPKTGTTTTYYTGYNAAGDLPNGIVILTKTVKNAPGALTCTPTFVD